MLCPGVDWLAGAATRAEEERCETENAEGGGLGGGLGKGFDHRGLGGLGGGGLEARAEDQEVGVVDDAVEVEVGLAPEGVVGVEVRLEYREVVEIHGSVEVGVAREYVEDGVPLGAGGLIEVFEEAPGAEIAIGADEGELVEGLAVAGLVPEGDD